MAKQIEGKLNRLERLIPEGLVVDSAWLGKHGYSSSLRSQYVSRGWLEQPARKVYRKKRGPLKWEQVVISLQTLLGCPLTVGGRTALELQGFAHYLSQGTREVHLYGPTRAPRWLNKLGLDVKFQWHNSETLFPLGSAGKTPAGGRDSRAGLVTQQWGQWEWSITLSSPERAILELLDELPEHETFHQVDKLFEGLPNLSPTRLEKLLIGCRSVKVKRLFFFFADRHQHAWLKRIRKEAIALGKGKRMLVRGGELNAAYQITVPGDLDGV
ncbi:MAG: type IV toxin-antitoxin system AbiEi family antitoxin [Bryobacterales bacterium]|nr:type IV toxin-antitoxin system AbiEi family antitoxin [Bryobacterales bacterium]